MSTMIERYKGKPKLLQYYRIVAEEINVHIVRNKVTGDIYETNLGTPNYTFKELK